MKIYIIDDSLAIRDRLASTLKERIQSAIIEMASDVNEVKAHLKEFSPDAMIIDIHLKEGTGFDVLALTKNLNIHPLQVVLTNYALPPYKEKAVRLGADYFFDKSEGFNDAIDAIEKHNSHL